MVLKYRLLDPLKYLIDEWNWWGHSLSGFSVLMKHQGHRPVKYWIKQGPHTFQTGTVVSLQIKQYHFIIAIFMMAFFAAIFCNLNNLSNYGQLKKYFQINSTMISHTKVG